MRDGFAAQLAEAAGASRPPSRPARYLRRSARREPIRPSPTTRRSIRTISCRRAIFRDRIVIVGLSLQNAPTLPKPAAPTRFATPFTVHTGRLVAGVEIQATIFDNLAERPVHRPSRARRSGDAVDRAWRRWLAALLVWRQTGWRTAAASHRAVGALLRRAAICLLRFGRVFVSPIGPALAYMSGRRSARARSILPPSAGCRRGITRAFSQYLSPALVERLAATRRS